MKSLKIVFMAVILFVGIGILAGCEQVSAQTGSYVTLDINPSIELIVSDDDIVTYANALNEDGEILLAELDLIGMELDAAIDLIIETSIELGFIDFTAEEVIVQVDIVDEDEENQEQVRNRVKAHINAAFNKRAMIGRAEDKGFLPEFVVEAETYGVTPGFLFMAKKAIEVDDELTLEVALTMEPSELQAILRTAKQEAKDIAAGLREEFLAERDALKEAFIEAKTELEAQIEAAAEEDKAALEAELQALVDQFIADMTALRESYLEESLALRLQYKMQFEARKAARHEAFEDFMNHVEDRKDQIQDRIDQFQGNRP
ncbi:MAG: hypothetical protein CVV58_06825 [Tenericutes bacterium HGW-Tenericutes-3]|nr:MAG: hypothetical protein CVV58_06825 [Tenericutes bacterium HGW-Tenericutes-3]